MPPFIFKFALYITVIHLYYNLIFLYCQTFLCIFLNFFELLTFFLLFYPLCTQKVYYVRHNCPRNCVARAGKPLIIFLIMPDLTFTLFLDNKRDSYFNCLFSLSICLSLKASCFSRSSSIETPVTVSKYFCAALAAFLRDFFIASISSGFSKSNSLS